MANIQDIDDVIQSITSPNGDYSLIWDVGDGSVPEHFPNKYGDSELAPDDFRDDVVDLFQKYPIMRIIEGHQFPDSVGNIIINGEYINDLENADELEDKLEPYDFFDKYFRNIALHAGADSEHYHQIVIFKKAAEQFYVYVSKETSSW